MKVAVMVDGAYFVHRLRACGLPHAEPEAVAKAVLETALRHASDDGGSPHDLYRIFFYDCAPVAKKAHYPRSHSSVDFSKTDKFRFQTSLHKALNETRKVALRLGRLQEAHGAWRLREGVLAELLAGKRDFAALTDDDFKYDVKQKGVDMRIGLDIASIAYKRQVQKIVLISGDADFVPAAKLARREGIDFVLDSMHQRIPDDLMQHIDGLKTFAPSPKATP